MQKNQTDKINFWQRQNSYFLAVIFLTLLFYLPKAFFLLKRGEYVEILAWSTVSPPIHLATKHFLKEAFAASCIFSLIALPLLVPFRWVRIIWWVLLPCLIFPWLILTGFITIFKYFPDYRDYYALFSTNFLEAYEFILHFSSTHLLFLFIILVGSLLSLWFLSKVNFLKKNYLSFIWILICLSVITIRHQQGKFWDLTAQVAWKTIYPETFYAIFSKYYQEVQVFKNLKKLRKEWPIPTVQRLGKLSDKETFVFILGESASRNHFSLYEYSRPTTPRLEELRNQLWVFEDVITTNSHTIEVQQKALTFLNNQDTAFKDLSVSVLDLFNQANFKTYWLSTQYMFEYYSTPITVLAQSADEIHFTQHRTNRYDDQLLPLFAKVLQDTISRKAIFLHIMGSHISYDKRYPPNFHPFPENEFPVDNDLSIQQKSIVDNYDKSIAFTDSLLSKIIERLQMEEGSNALLYYSDHGDEVHDLGHFAGHTDNRISRFMLEIPFFVWTNKAYAQYNPNIVQLLPETLNRPHSLEHLIHTVQDMTNIYTDRFQPARSLLNSEFVPTERLVPNGNYDSLISSVNRYRQLTAPDTMSFPNAIWYHRANSKERLKDVQQRFKGIELDIVFEIENNAFDVRHDIPRPSIPYQGISLENYLIEAEKKGSDFCFWLDYKNLSNENRNTSLRKLLYLDSLFDIKHRVVVESTNPKPLQAFYQAGFFTSYYLPSLRGKNQFELIPLVDSIGYYLDQQKYSAISQDISMYRVMREYFPHYPKLVWDANLDGHDPDEETRAFNFLAQDSTVKILLVDDFPKIYP